MDRRTYVRTRTAPSRISLQLLAATFSPLQPGQGDSVSAGCGQLLTRKQKHRFSAPKLAALLGGKAGDQAARFADWTSVDGREGVETVS